MIPLGHTIIDASTGAKHAAELDEISWSLPMRRLSSPRPARTARSGDTAKDDGATL